MSDLICFGLGYSAEHFIGMFGDSYERIIATVRSADRAASVNARLAGRLKALLFDGESASPELLRAIGRSDAALVSIPQDASGDPVLRACGDTIALAPRLRTVVYLSTVGVYGDRGGEWVDEEAPPTPRSGRSRERVAAEQAWQEFGKRHGIPVAILRLAGIYGPDRNAFVQIARGGARCVVKPGQVFNRIHVEDIAQAIDAAFSRKASGIFNVADDEPSPSSDPLVLAAQLMGVPPPPEIGYDEAAPGMSPLAKSFWQECRRVGNTKLKRDLGVRLRYPTYREGLRALWDKWQGRVIASTPDA